MHACHTLYSGTTFPWTSSAVVCWLGPGLLLPEVGMLELSDVGFHERYCSLMLFIDAYLKQTIMDVAL